ncbi:hypothetical protein N658DRAFT_562145 [Parathielavia hyrcaniae]|uniref:Uncharacterized protein n=1 Tax=Parathielavia hyrcaniae TaxID=113614 RepID=A0AAN6PS03_9PEZI|nr:hypothetical protein N658DRAFT_562145 [Parathielavia hyrcaniae]
MPSLGAQYKKLRLDTRSRLSFVDTASRKRVPLDQVQRRETAPDLNTVQVLGPEQIARDYPPLGSDESSGGRLDEDSAGGMDEDYSPGLGSDSTSTTTSLDFVAYLLNKDGCRESWYAHASNPNARKQAAKRLGNLWSLALDSPGATTTATASSGRVCSRIEPDASDLCY